MEVNLFDPELDELLSAQAPQIPTAKQAKQVVDILKEQLAGTSVPKKGHQRIVEEESSLQILLEREGIWAEKIAERKKAHLTKK
jgi:hypothetical protein